jgi:bZIP transcription factor
LLASYRGGHFLGSRLSHLTSLLIKTLKHNHNHNITVASTITAATDAAAEILNAIYIDIKTMDNDMLPKKRKLVSSTSSLDSSGSDSLGSYSNHGSERSLEKRMKTVRADGKKYVGKNSLTEEELIKAKILSREKNNDNLTEDDKKEQRRAANRLSAFQSRQRRKIIIEDLQRTVARISKDNSDERKKSDDLQAELDAVKRENEVLRQLLSSAQSSSPVKAQEAPQTQVHSPSLSDSESMRNYRLLLNSSQPSSSTQLNGNLGLMQRIQGMLSHQQLGRQHQSAGEPGGSPTGMLCLLNDLAHNQGQQQRLGHMVKSPGVGMEDSSEFNNIVALLHGMQQQQQQHLHHPGLL